MSLPRLTDAIVKREIERSGSQQAGWHALCTKGYTPGEVALFCDRPTWANDVRQRVRMHAEKYELPIPASCARSREPRESKPAGDWREAFRGTVMRTGMQLSLTQTMLEFICATADGVQWDRMGNSTLARPDGYLVTAASLEKRGLVKRRVTTSAETMNGASFHELTDAGKCVVELLKVTGVFTEADRAIEKRERRS